MAERTFLAIYGSPALQAACGIDPHSQGAPLRKAASEPAASAAGGGADCRTSLAYRQGGVREASMRAALYVGMARQSVDERGFESIRRMRLASTDHQRLTLAQFKTMVREQFFMLLIDQEAALAAIPALLPPGADERQAALAAISDVISASGELSGDAAERMKRIANLFDGGKPRIASAANS